MGQGVHMDCVIPESGLSATGEAMLTPDPASLVNSLPWWPAHGMACCDLLERSGEPWECCPRSALKRTLALLKERHGVTILAGFELEFVLLKEESGGGMGGASFAPVDSALYSSTAGLDAQCEVLDEMVSALVDMGIDVVQWHKEAAHGQFEISTGPADALTAADRLIQSKEAISAIARRHGLAATFVPKPMADQAGSGCHMHLSLWKDGRSVMCADPTANSSGSSPPALSEMASAFFGGLLAHLPAVLPFASPSTGPWGSYGRLQPGCWAGAFGCWGWDNREAPLRATCPGGPETANIEMKSVDGTANPYIALAAVACAGMLGVSTGCRLPDSVEGSPENASSGGGEEGGAPALLPRSLAEALAAFERDDALQSAVVEGLGLPLLRAFMAVRAGEIAADPGLAEVLLRY